MTTTSDTRTVAAGPTAEAAATTTDVRVVLPAHLRALARVQGQIVLPVAAPVTQRAVLDALEARHPVLAGCVRDRATGRRRAFVRFYACQEDVSNDAPDDLLPEAVVTGAEPYLVVGAMAGG